MYSSRVCSVLTNLLQTCYVYYLDKKTNFWICNPAKLFQVCHRVFSKGAPYVHFLIVLTFSSIVLSSVKIGEMHTEIASRLGCCVYDFIIDDYLDMKNLNAISF